MKPGTDISQVVLDALMELEAESVASKLGTSIENAREGVRDLWDEGELEARSIGDGKYILCRRGGTWLQSVGRF
jgi:predicted transcriptional regulator